MDRRTFLAGCGALVALLLRRWKEGGSDHESRPLVPAPPKPSEPSHYILYADGEHDDTEALQAYIDGKPVYFRDGERADLTRRGGMFSVSDTLYLRRDDGPGIVNCSFRGLGQDRTYFVFPPAEKRTWWSNFRGNSVWTRWRA